MGLAASSLAHECSRDGGKTFNYPSCSNFATFCNNPANGYSCQKDLYASQVLSAYNNTVKSNDEIAKITTLCLNQPQKNQASDPNCIRLANMCYANNNNLACQNPMVSGTLKSYYASSDQLSKKVYDTNLKCVGTEEHPQDDRSACDELVKFCSTHSEVPACKDPVIKFTVNQFSGNNRYMNADKEKVNYDTAKTKVGDEDENVYSDSNAISEALLRPSSDGRCGHAFGEYCPKGSYCSMWGWCGTGNQWKQGNSPYRLCNTDDDTKCIKENTCNNGFCSNPDLQSTISNPINLSLDAKCGSSAKQYCPQGSYCSKWGWCGSGDMWKDGNSPYRLCNDSSDTSCIRKETCNGNVCSDPLEHFDANCTVMPKIIFVLIFFIIVYYVYRSYTS